MGTIQSCQAAIGYRRPDERECCRSCAHVLVIKEGNAWAERQCGLHGFWTSSMSVCNKFERRVLPTVIQTRRGGTA